METSSQSQTETSSVFDIFDTNHDVQDHDTNQVETVAILTLSFCSESLKVVSLRLSSFVFTI